MAQSRNMELLVVLIFLGSFQVKGNTFEHEKLDFLMDARILTVKPCLPTLSAEWWDEFFITPLSEILDAGPINVCFQLYPEIENCWAGTIDKINAITDKFGPHLELVWSSLQKYEPYLNGSFCNLQESQSYHIWQTYDECEKCNNAKEDFLKDSFYLEMTKIFKKVLKNDFCHYINSTSDFGESECGDYVEDIIPRVGNWFQDHILYTDRAEDSVCRDHCSSIKQLMLEESPKHDTKMIYEKSQSPKSLRFHQCYFNPISCFRR